MSIIPVTASLLIGCYIGAGIVIILLGIPLMTGRVKPNGMYGFRTAKTFASEPIWYAANRYLGREMVKAGRTVVICSTILLVINIVARFQLATLAALGGAIASFPVMVALVKSIIYVRDL